MTSKISYVFASSSNILIWITSGIAVAIFLLHPKNYWPKLITIIFIINLIVKFSLKHSFVSMIGFVIVDTFGPLLCSWLLVKWCGKDITFTRLNEILALILAAIFTSALSGFFAASYAAFFGAPFFSLWRTWWIADGLAILLVTPLIVTWFTEKELFNIPSIGNIIEIIIIMVVSLVLVLSYFGKDCINLPFVTDSYMLCIPLIWVSCRLGPCGTTTWLISLAITELGITILGISSFPLGGNTSTEKVFYVQLYLAAKSSVALLLAGSFSERKASEELIKKNEEFLRTIIEYQPEMLVRWQPDGTRTFINDAYCKTFNQKREELIGTSFMPLVAEEYREAILEKIRSITFDNPVAIDIHESVSITGEKFWQEWIDRGIFDKNGNLLEIQSSGRDVTKRKRAEQAVQESEARLRIITRELTERVKELTALHQAFRLFQSELPPNKEFFTRLVALLPPAWQYPEICQARICYGEIEVKTDDWRETPWKQSVKFTTKDGQKGSVEVVYLEERETKAEGPFLAEERDLIQSLADMLTTYLDRRRAEKLLYFSEERFRVAIQHSPIGFALVAPNGKWLNVNPAICSIVGYTKEELLKLDFQTITYPDDLDIDLNYVQQMLKREIETYQMEKRYIHKNGHIVWTQLNVSLVLDSENQPLYFVAQIQDITQRKEAEEEIRQLNLDLERRVKQRTIELEAANKELEAFSYSISHDLRSPLRTIDGFSQAVLEDYAHMLPEDGQRYLHMIREGAQRMGALIDDLLSFSRLSRQPINNRLFDPTKLVNDLYKELKEEHKGRSVEFQIEALPLCQGDPSLLKQVWSNLLSNALKYTRVREQAVIKVGYKEIEEEKVYFIEDNGAGFDMKYAHKLFGVFQRLHQAEEFEGTGVGLAIVQRIITRHGGRIWTEAAKDKGATFYFTLEGVQKNDRN